MVACPRALAGTERDSSERRVNGYLYWGSQRDNFTFSTTDLQQGEQAWENFDWTEKIHQLVGSHKPLHWKG